GTVFQQNQADVFNSFINNLNMFDVPLGGFRYTWTDKWASKMSKLDRFLVIEGFHDSFPHITCIVLEKGVPDHRPILLKESVVDYGSTPFRFFHSWLDIECFHDLVVDTCKNYECSETNGMISFKKKLQHLKQVIREWNSSKTLSDNQLRKEHQSRLSFIDVKMDQGTTTREDLNCRVSLMKILGDIERNEKKRRQIAIKCVFKNGVWIEEPGKVKEEFYDHFCSRLSYSHGDRPSLRDMSFNQISLEQRESLESDCTNDEIKRAVWDCGGDSAPGPDGFTFKFFKTLWETIQSDVVRW
ncbi:RNA-directed DNA polymerase, eukaryota, reverse transcriptase zinc-binding domain protein, partial [Tanacetum coccineum]